MANHLAAAQQPLNLGNEFCAYKNRKLPLHYLTISEPQRYSEMKFSQIYDTKASVQTSRLLYDPAMGKKEYLSIPNWAATLTAFGLACALLGFILAWLSSSGFATLVLTLGLAIAAIGFNAAERALKNAARK